jgi:hypothetical protein
VGNAEDLAALLRFLEQATRPGATNPP